ncbi:signal peptidase II [Magnetospirillum sp. UT-4]|uniref:signal peptidase II n=1 Tax=Magnetospirillum sp. UT-4 TaxID=2681467 RepID=UPI001385E9FC|nr:signal peptidase II [Magnetospirillum sp. UT-4]CAA7613206.1 Lipoprotein signal peptidase [Magnetospirillum sp. UT-4]
MLRPGLILAAIVMILDQATKWWIVETVMRPEGVAETPFFSPVRIEVLPVFDLVMAWNRGVSFGIFNTDGPWNALVLSVLSLVISGGLVLWLHKAETRLVGYALGAIIGGALGNVVDRIRWGAVADFLDVHVAGWHWPAFNLADSAITVGAVLLVLDALFPRRDLGKN